MNYQNYGRGSQSGPQQRNRPKFQSVSQYSQTQGVPSRPIIQGKQPGPNRPSPRRPRQRKFLFRRVLSGLVLLLLLILGGRWVYGMLFPVQEETTETFSETEQNLDSTSKIGPLTPALDYSGFDPGNIIADEIFYDTSTMSQSEIEKFIADTNDGCVTGSDGTECIAAYTEDSPSYEADDYCYAFEGSPGDTAAAIIYKSANACGINPQVLLTMLQKEQGLLTASGRNLNETRYNIAMGFGCPDDSNCDEAYFGYAKQVYYAAHQLRVYANNPAKYSIQPYMVNTIAYTPSSACGSGEIYVENYATAGLYNYTPYQPDQTALNGETGACSSYGNMNFYAYFKAWFG